MGDSGKSLFDLEEESPALTVYNSVIDNIEGFLNSNKKVKVPPREKSPKKSKTKKEKVMNIAIPTVGGKICSHFGHCEKFAMVKSEGTEIIEVEYLTPPPHEPGSIPTWLHEQKADVVITGGMGSRAQQIFTEHGIKVVTGVTTESTPEEIAEKFLKNELETGGNVCDH